MKKLSLVFMLSLLMSGCSERPIFSGHQLGSTFEDIDKTYKCQKIKAGMACSKKVSTDNYSATNILLYQNGLLKYVTIDFYDGDIVGCNMVKELFVLKAGTVKETVAVAVANSVSYHTDDLIVNQSILGDYCNVNVTTKDTRVEELKKKTGM